MTAARKLKSAAVVEGEVKRKTSATRTVQVVSTTAVSAASVKSGSTTATATNQVASSAVAEPETSGSRAATNLRAAAKRATRLSASIFPQISNTQRIQYPPGRSRRKGFCVQVAQAE